MEGACVFIDNDFSTILMYKEIKKNLILYVKLNFAEFYINYINIYDFFKIFPYNYIHILNNLPYFNDINITLEIWKNMALNRLNFLNKFK